MRTEPIKVSAYQQGVGGGAGYKHGAGGGAGPTAPNYKHGARGGAGPCPICPICTTSNSFFCEY